ncbi:Ig-like domain-containing protein [Streptomyces sp. NBC_01017]|uniref:PxKF domain-containing protein n=1 Tax=Streptomyces sp. NBC_01017 TaxID=2903721 RepID=UPI00386357B9|nr:Ig-like domain-containing protein [Streptomyces sp. NBC_01017]WSV34725.1 Ig-like domain-containing protein [Streptomyces sp. NBC_01017]
MTAATVVPLTMTSSASAADEPCTTAGHTVTCTYIHTDTEQTLTLPDTVDTVDITAIGAAGGNSLTNGGSVISGAGGRGAIVDAYNVPVTDAAVTEHQRTLYVMVGGPGADGAQSDGGGQGGFNGGGGYSQEGSGTTSLGGGGGGASDVRTRSSSSTPLTLQDSRLVVAGGGGGGGRYGGQGGTAAGPGGINDYDTGYGDGLDGEDGDGFDSHGGKGADSNGVFHQTRTGGEGGGGGGGVGDDLHVAGGGGGASPDSFRIQESDVDGGPGGGGGGTSGGKAGQPLDVEYRFDATDGTLGQGGNPGVFGAVGAGGGGGYYGGGPGDTQGELGGAGGGGAGSSYSVTTNATAGPVPADNPVASQVIITYTLDVNKADSSTTLSSSRNPSAPGESVVLTAHVDSSTASPGGDVVFSRTGSSTPLGTAPVEAGSASFTVPAASLQSGDNAFTAAYQGDSTHNGSAGEIVQRVQYATSDPFFLSPIDPDAVNLLKASQAVPVKFTLDGNQGMNVIAAGYPRYTRTACTGGEPTDLTDETTTSQAGLTYDNGTYSYVWKTKKDWAGQCGTLNIKLADNTTHTIQVRFK